MTHWDCAVQSSLCGTIIDTQSHYFEPHENLDNIAEVPFLELHVAVMKKREKLDFLTSVEKVMASQGANQKAGLALRFQLI